MEGEEQLIKDRLQKLIERMKQLGYNSYMIRRAKQLVNELEQIGVYSIDKFVKKLSDQVNRKQEYQEYLDILREGRFAIVLAKNQFSQITFIKEKQEQRLPDIRASYARHTIYFEVTRRRPRQDDLAVQSKVAIVSRDRAENIISKIQSKMSQLQSGETNIVVFWSDTVTVDKYAMENAFEKIKEESKQDPRKYEALSGVLLVESAETVFGKSYLFKNDKASKPLGTRLTRKLEFLHEQNLKQLQREMEELVAAFKKM